MSIYQSTAAQALISFILNNGRTVSPTPIKPETKAQIRPFQRGTKRSHSKDLLLTFNPKVFSSNLEVEGRILTLGPQYNDPMIITREIIKLPQGQTLPTATDLLRHQVPLLPRIDTQTLQLTNWKPRKFALLQRRMALGFHKILEAFRSLEKPDPENLTVIKVQTLMTKILPAPLNQAPVLNRELTICYDQSDFSDTSSCTSTSTLSSPECISKRVCALKQQTWADLVTEGQAIITGNPYEGATQCPTIIPDHPNYNPANDDHKLWADYYTDSE